MKYKNLDCVTNNQKLEGKERTGKFISAAFWEYLGKLFFGQSIFSDSKYFNIWLSALKKFIYIHLFSEPNL